MNASDYSIYLETLDKRYTSAILSIGVAQFDRRTGEIGATFYQEIDIDSAIKVGTISGDTLRWWLTQGEKARRVFGTEKKVSLATGLDALATWLRSQPCQPVVWRNGATFDISILEYAYDKGCIGLQPAWHFRNIRDMRTAVDLADFSHNEQGAPAQVGTAHNALDDAIYQAKVIAYCYQKLKGIETKRAMDPPKSSGPQSSVLTDDDDL